MLQLFSMIKSKDGIKRRGDFFWSVVDFSFEKDPIGHIFTIYRNIKFNIKFFPPDQISIRKNYVLHCE